MFLSFFRVIDWIKQGFEKVVPQSPINLGPPSSSETPFLKAASAPVTPYKQASSMIHLFLFIKNEIKNTRLSFS